MDTRLTMLALCAGTTLIPSIAHADLQLYGIGFENPGGDAAGVWSHHTRSELGGPYTNILGRFGNETVTLRLNATEANTAGLGDSGAGAGGGDGSGGGGQGDRPFNLQSRPVLADRIRVPYPDDGGGGNGGNRPPDNPFSFDYDGPKFDLGGGWNGGGDPPDDRVGFTAGTYALKFDLMLFDSWDADSVNFGPDKFAVNINGVKVFDEFLQIHHLPDNFRMPDEIPTQNAYNNAWQDLIFRDITLYFDIATKTDHFDFSFVGTLDQGLADESWGIDNIRVEAVGRVASMSSPVVPTPASLTLLAGGIGLMTKRRR
ncbi:MAG: hypothetical protein ACF8LL_04655 [Phycisphaerales bacterium]